MSDSGKILNVNDMEQLLVRLAVKLSNKYPRKVINFYIVGGCAMVMGYRTRYGSTDIDAFWSDDLNISKDVKEVAKEFNIQDGWLNSDFKKSEGYTNAIMYNSTLYSTILNCNFYIVNPELLLCMKLIAFRTRVGKYDIDDLYNLEKILNNRGIYLNPELIIDWLEKFYNPVPELKQGALNFIYGKHT